MSIPKKSAIVIVVVLAVGVGLWARRANENEIAAKLASEETANIIATQNTPEITPEGTLAKVIRVIDGDTIVIEGGERVRYIGMDAPETVDPKKPVQCFGPEASAENKLLVEGKTVRLEKDVSDKDIYGRLLRYVWLDGTNIDLELVQLGFAFSDPFPPNTKYKNQILQAEQSARSAHLGLWSACPPRD
ncbi:MAG: thermonuclease family protein [Minisyncoccia bacterium]